MTKSRLALPVASLILSVCAGILGSIGCAVAVASTANDLGLPTSSDV